MDSSYADVSALEALGAEYTVREVARSEAREALGAAFADGPAAGPRRRRWSRPGRLVALALALAVPAAAAVAAGLSSDAEETYSGFLVGAEESSALGRPVEPSDDPPGWMLREGVDARVLASREGLELFAAREPDGAVSFAFEGIQVTSPGPDLWLEVFQGRAVVPVAWGASDERGPWALGGVAGSGVASIELRYSSGSPDVIEDPNAAFIFLVDLGDTEIERGILQVDRLPEAIVAYDEDGNVIEEKEFAAGFAMPVMELRGGSEYDPPQALEPGSNAVLRGGRLLPSGE